MASSSYKIMNSIPGDRLLHMVGYAAVTYDKKYIIIIIIFVYSHRGDIIRYHGYV